jgi:hypothetical protein
MELEQKGRTLRQTSRCSLGRSEGHVESITNNRVRDAIQIACLDLRRWMDGKAFINVIRCCNLGAESDGHPADCYELFLESSTLYPTPSQLKYTDSPIFAEGAKAEVQGKQLNGQWR